ncbi:hypothetical protein PPYR_00026 [Photinus pyralis]|uniref:Uncharacterized protein n=1 Tax=Photinus pyralis TaxID=7054 RepID=A0A5N4B0G2_PHOPY|nr:hypothetical protein PPYR_00026 [Photinus pyralis]
MGPKKKTFKWTPELSEILIKCANNLRDCRGEIKNFAKALRELLVTEMRTLQITYVPSDKALTNRLATLESNKSKSERKNLEWNETNKKHLLVSGCFAVNYNERLGKSGYVELMYERFVSHVNYSGSSFRQFA